jgi:ABC-2 type transport system ATP-binding protein
LLIETHALTKTYRAVTALDRCSVGITAGEVFGFLGPNGAGKTTLLRLLLGFLTPTSGGAIVDGLDCVRQSLEVRRRIAYVPGEARLFRSMRGRDALLLVTRLRSKSKQTRQRALDLAERLELDLTRRVAYMSTGMRQKLALAATLAAATPIVILDEPTSSLDPSVRRTVLTLVREAKAAGQTVIFSSHVLAEAEEACDRVAILRAGRLVHLQAMHELRRRHRIQLFSRNALPAPPAEIAAELTPYENEAAVGDLAARLHVTNYETPGDLRPVLGWLSTLPIEDVRIESLGLRATYEAHHPAESSASLPAMNDPNPFVSPQAPSALS